MSKRLLALSLLIAAASGAAAPAAAFTPDPAAVTLDQEVDYTLARLMVALDRNRHKTLDSFARESFSALYGEDHLPGLSPLGSLFEWLFNREAYLDQPVLKIRPLGLRYEFTAHMPPETRQRVLDTKLMTLREYADPVVQDLIQQYEPRFDLVSAIRKVREAERTGFHLNRVLNIVPAPQGDERSAWHTPAAAVATLMANDPTHANLPAALGEPIPGLTPQQAQFIARHWAGLRAAWLSRDAEAVQTHLDKLAAGLPEIAPAGVYPSAAQRAAEAKYYAMGKFTWGWVIYFAATLFAVGSLITRWRWVQVVTMVLLLAAAGLHAYGLGLRWYILGRIPVANMFEAVVASAWMGIVAALVFELFLRTRVFPIAAGAAGFCALIAGQFVIPGGGTLTAIVAILDDIMLRIHTTLIIFSYALIFLAAVIAIVYLAVYYLRNAPARAAEMGFTSAAGGLVLLAMLPVVFTSPAASASYTKVALAAPLFGGAGLLLAIGTIVALLWRTSGPIIGLLTILLLVSSILANGNYEFIRLCGLVGLIGGLVWGGLMLLGVRRQGAATPPWEQEQEQEAFGGPGGGGGLLQRPVLAGGLPGDRLDRADNSPLIQQIDWAHLILLNMAFVLLFVGVILGAVWADYSWGRPWGWDPKETFALNTWIIYAILIHVRFIVRNKGLWTAWLSIIGCLMMLFNWIFVNFFIVGLHSYA